MSNINSTNTSFNETFQLSYEDIKQKLLSDTVSIILSSLLLPSLQQRSTSQLSTPSDDTVPEKKEESFDKSNKMWRKVISIVSKTIYKLGGVDSEHAVSKKDIIIESSKQIVLELPVSTKSSTPTFSKSVTKQLEKLVKCGFVQKNIKGYYLTPKGKKKYEEPTESKKVEKSIIKTICEKEEDENILSNKSDLINEGFYIYCLYLLRKEKSYRIGFTIAEIYYKMIKVRETYPQMNFVKDDKILLKNINDGYVTVNKGKYNLSEEGKAQAHEIFIKCNPEKPKPKTQKKH